MGNSVEAFPLLVWLSTKEAEARSGVRTQLDTGKAIAYQNVIDYINGEYVGEFD